MGFLILGLLLVLGKLLDLPPMALWAWGWVLAPFGLTVLWWWWSDATGRTRRLAAQREVDRQRERQRRQAASLRPGGKSSDGRRR